MAHFALVGATLLTITSLVVQSAFAMPLPASPEGYDHTCEIGFTATFETDNIDYEPLDLGDGALSGAGGSPVRSSNTGTVRAKVLNVRATGAFSEFGGLFYVPDFLAYSWEVRVSPPTWQFLWGGIFYSLSYNGRSTFHGAFLNHPLGTRREGQEMITVGLEGVTGQRVPPQFRPADLIRAFTSVTFRLWERTPRGVGRLTVRENRAPFREPTLSYSVAPPEECTFLAN